MTPTSEGFPAVVPIRPISTPPRPDAAGASAVDAALDEMMLVDGAVACALLDVDAGLLLGIRDDDVDFDVARAAHGYARVLSAQLSAMARLNLDEQVDDVVVTLDHQHHLVRPLRATGQLMLYLVVDRDRTNLGMARYRMAAYDRGLLTRRESGPPPTA